MKGFEEAQKSFLNILQITHRRIFNILLNYTSKKDIKTDLVKVLDFVHDEMRVIEKDIEKEAAVIEKSDF